MKRRWLCTLLIITSVLGISATGRGQDTVYHLGVPKGYNAPGYDQLFSALENKKVVRGDNLQIVTMDLDDFRAETGKARIRQEIAQQCDLFFTTGDHLGILLEVQIQTPLLFVGIKGPNHELSPAMQANTTGVYRGSTANVFLQSAKMLPADQRQKLGLIYFRGSQLATLAPQYQELCKEQGLNLVIKEYDGRDDIERVMREFKAEEVQALVLFPPAARAEELPELIAWQNRLKLPILGQVKDQIEKGLLGRDPATLPIYYFPEKYVINLRAANILQQEIPESITRQAEIIR